MTELDDALRESFARLAEPGDPAGVVDSIRTRLDAGDTGTPANSSGFGSGGGTPWLVWGAVVVVVALAGGAIGATGALGSPAAPQPGTGVSLAGGVDALDCPAGAAVTKLGQGDRVLALSRSDDYAYLEVRNPQDVNQLVWLPAGVVVVDRGEPAISTLPVGGCPKPVLAVDAVPVADPTVAPPAPAPKPKPAGDTTSPVIAAGAFSPNPVYGTQSNTGLCPTSTTISITATDNVGVATVTGATTSGPGGAQITQISHSGSTYVFKYQIDYEGGEAIAVVGFTAKDAAGNQSATSSKVTVRAGHYPNNCWLG